MNQTSLSHFQTAAPASAAISQPWSLGEHGEARNVRAHTHADMNINRQKHKQTDNQTSRHAHTATHIWVSTRERETQRLLSPSTAQALQSPFEDFKNHLGPLSIFVKQVNLRATAHWIQRERRDSDVESMSEKGKGRKMSPKWNLGECGMEDGWQQVEGEGLWTLWFSLKNVWVWIMLHFWPGQEIDAWFVWCLDIISVVVSDMFHVFLSLPASLPLHWICFHWITNSVIGLWSCVDQ